MGNSSSIARNIHSPSTFEIPIIINQETTAHVISNDTNISVMATPSKTKILLNAFLGHRTQNPLNYIPTLIGRKEKNIKVWWFPQDFCQSRLGDRVIGSNACTLIAVCLAHRIQYQKITIHGEVLSIHLISALAESIIDGNHIYEGLENIGELRHPTLTLPEAMKYCNWMKEDLFLGGSNLDYSYQNLNLTELSNFLVTDANIKTALFEAFNRGIMAWEVEHKESIHATSNLFMILITDGRSFLLVYQRHRRQVTFMDSHGHRENGALVCQSNIVHIKELCDWFVDMCRAYFSETPPSTFEVSFLHFR